jgi:hypothetical protein
MSKLATSFLILVFLFFQNSFAQTAAEVKYVGTYESTEILELSLAVRKLDPGFEVQFLINGQLFIGEAIPALGILNGTYTFQGNPVAFSISRIIGQYYLTTEGYDIPLSKVSETSTDLSEFIAKTEAIDQSGSGTDQKATSKPLNETEGSTQLKNALQGRRLLYLYTANGGSDKKFFDLCSDGSYYYYSNYSYLSGGFSGGTTDEDQGSWEISQVGDQMVLVLNSQKGELIEIVLTAGNSQGELMGNGRRYFISTNETCR